LNTLYKKHDNYSRNKGESNRAKTPVISNFFFTLVYAGSEVGFQLLQLIGINIKFWVYDRHIEEGRAGNKLLSAIQTFLWVIRKTRSSEG